MRLRGVYVYTHVHVHVCVMILVEHGLSLAHSNPPPHNCRQQSKADRGKNGSASQRS
jgi:hypothetical protein